MDDDKLKDIFAGFNPEISDSADFMAGLNRHLELAELARQRLEAARRRSKRAVIIAAIAGFGGGVMSALCYPALLRLAASWSVETRSDRDGHSPLIFYSIRRVSIDWSAGAGSWTRIIFAPA